MYDRHKAELEHRAQIKALLNAYRASLRCGCKPVNPENSLIRNWAKFQYEFLGTHSPSCIEAQEALHIATTK